MAAALCFAGGGGGVSPSVGDNPGVTLAIPWLGDTAWGGPGVTVLAV